MSPGHWLYNCGGALFLLFESHGKASGDHDQLGFGVPDVSSLVQELKANGVVFETYDFAPMVGDVWRAETAENQYRRAAWFKDSEGNLLSIVQRLDGKTVGTAR